MTFPLEIDLARLSLTRLDDAPGKQCGDDELPEPGAERVVQYDVQDRRGQRIGTGRLVRSGRYDGAVEVHCEISPSQRGLRYGIETVAAMTREAHRAGVGPVWAVVSPRHRSARKIVQALGYELVRSEDQPETDGSGGSVGYYRHDRRAGPATDTTATVIVERQSVAMGDDVTAPNPFTLEVTVQDSGRIRLRDLVDTLLATYDGPNGGWVSVANSTTTWVLSAVSDGPGLAVLTCTPVRLHAYTFDPETLLDPMIPVRLHYSLSQDPEQLRQLVAREPFRRRL